MRPIRTLSISSIALLTVLAFSACGAELRNFEDAALHAVQFWDNREGWAVGDEGVIWHTIDGGKHWERQPSGVRASLRSLHFLDPYTGWIAGREELPNGAGSAGVVLYTKDGGLHWQRVMLNVLPGLNRVRFVNEQSGYKVGYLVGDGNDAHPSGVFLTTDGGRSWQPVPGARSASWLAAAFNDNGEGALAGAWNRLATVRKDRVFQVNMDTLGGRSLRDLQLRGDDGMAVGQGGLILRSQRTRGSSWDYVTKLPIGEEARRAWDFHAVHGVGPHYWVVGRPGSAALHSADRGQTWSVVRTGQPLPLNGIFFTDEQHGWAVGEFGTIMATSDGGQTWQAQHRGGQRAAVLMLHARADGIPLDTMAQLGGQDGYLCATLRVTASDLTTAALTRSAEAARFSAAVRQAGGASGEMLWAFPLSSHLLRAPRADLLRAWDTLHGDQAAEQLLRQLVLSIRMWRPAVLITDAAEEKGEHFACDALLAEAVRAAFERAADPKTFPDQLSALGLEPWQTAKVYALGKGASPVILDLTVIATRLQATVRDFATGPAALLAGAAVTLPDQRDFHLLAAHMKDAEAHRDLMQSTNLAPGGLARRMIETAEEMPEEIVKAIRQRTTMKALSEAPAGPLTDPNRLLAQIGPMLAKMPDDQAAPAAFAAANQYARLGQWGLAREAFLLLVDRYPTHPLAMDGYRWLIRHNSSTEARHRHELGQFIVVEHVQHGVPDKEGLTLGKPGEPDAGKPGIKLPAWNRETQQAPDIPTMKAKELGQKYLFAKKDQIRQWYQSSLDLEPRLAAFGPLLTSDPAVQFCLQAARRNLGDFQTPHQWYTQFVARQPEGPWRAAAAAELWLAHRAGPPPKPVLPCRFTDTRPLLDGNLNESCWQAPPVKLHNAAGETVQEFTTEARLAYDKDYLYIALKCTHPASRYVPPLKPRTRDADLRGHDRVSVMLDLDRDYCTCFHLQIDQRGCVCEDCWGDKKWDPRWFVAVQSEPTCWTVEAAIPLVALTSDAIASGKAWACNVVRVVPGRGVQAWSLPAEVPEESLRPEGMGLLLFSQEGQPASGERAPTQQ
jgi:photosystem II stability/assembly factor-like uncharacterized protein/tetratricopeptide (TPR) repeat protein